ncbi:hypothetical protein HPC49_08730 [Pyxidicoccus fallax]|uniref:Uncharacterized protein n=1 Tax=Pyxidicoccus fallax TaxID=394095 RepID=A0A848L9T6_9BACT|nr:hypothetical protein [Pyxidicoccus fallax]NMO13433.1 hypothetical protein [Pyxidicoccus fallax]NPC78329.1 hypothetical protein [Pyxidicoccus fallax]
MKLQDAQGTIDIRLEAGGAVSWQRSAWQGKLNVQADREPSGTLKVTVWRPGVEAPLKSAVLEKGQALVITPGKDVPAGYFGPGHQPVKFIADE